jgi:hypothetical protein
MKTLHHLVLTIVAGFSGSVFVRVPLRRAKSQPRLLQSADLHNFKASLESVAEVCRALLLCLCDCVTV